MCDIYVPLGNMPVCHRFAALHSWYSFHTWVGMRNKHPETSSGPNIEPGITRTWTIQLSLWSWMPKSLGHRQKKGNDTKDQFKRFWRQQKTKCNFYMQQYLVGSSKVTVEPICPISVLPINVSVKNFSWSWTAHQLQEVKNFKLFLKESFHVIHA